MTIYHLDLDQRDADIISGALRSAYTYCLDAMAASAGSTWPEREPSDVTRHRDTLDRIERVSAAVGHVIDTKRRVDTEDYYQRTSDEYWSTKLLQSHGVIT